MRVIRKYDMFLESKGIMNAQAVEEPKKKSYKSKNLVQEICVSMILLNPEFLDNILDRGLKARYTENSQVFLTDLKNMILAKNRLYLGKFSDDRCVVDEESSKINSVFGNISFDIEEDWNVLVDSRITARNIIDKLLPDQKLDESLIRRIYWIGPNKDRDHSEDLVIELKDGRQFSFFLNKAMTGSKTSSFNTFADDLIGNDVEKMYGEGYLPKWDKLVQDWVKILYENSNKNIQIHIAKFIEPQRMDSLGYFEYFELKHRDPRFKNLGEHIKEFDKNILKFSDLMSEVWKNRKSCFMDPERIYREWMEKKIFILNSKILEHLLTESLTSNSLQDIEKLQDGFKLAKGRVKMKLVKTVVEKLGCLERPVLYLGNKGNSFHQVPSRKFFRDNYEDLEVKFDYHVKMVVDENEEENNDFVIKMKIGIDGNHLMDCVVSVRFSGGEMSGKLSAKYAFEPVDNFNTIVSEKTKISDED
jgi:hypothetical protein